MTSNTSPAQSHRSRLCLSRECPFLCVVPAWHPHLYCTVSMSPHKKKPSPVSMSKMNICSQEVCKIGYESQERACLIPCGANRMDGQRSSCSSVPAHGHHWRPKCPPWWSHQMHSPAEIRIYLKCLYYLNTDHSTQALTSNKIAHWWISNYLPEFLRAPLMLLKVVHRYLNRLVGFQIPQAFQ
jgi:hypothetical protein